MRSWSPPAAWRDATLGKETESESVRSVSVGLVLWSLTKHRTRALLNIREGHAPAPAHFPRLLRIQRDHRLWPSRCPRPPVPRAISISRHPLSRAPGPVSLGARPPTGRLTQFAPVLLIQLHFVFLRGGFDAFPGGIAFSIGHPLHLGEAGDRVAHVSSVMDGFLALLGESEVLVGDMIAASLQ